MAKTSLGLPRRKALERRLRVEFPSDWPAWWTWLEFKEYLDEYDDVLYDVDEMVAIVRNQRKAGQVARPDRRSRLAMEDAYTEAVSCAWWSAANAEPSVKRFRDEVLGGELVDGDGVYQWVQEELERQGDPTLYVTVDDETGERLRGEWKFLSYPSEGGEFRCVCHLRRGSTLDRLRLLSEHLAGTRPWQEAQAVAFVLTDAVPVVSSIDSTITWGRSPSVTLRVDAHVPPEAVSAAYSAARRELVGAGQRHRPPGDRALRVASFASLHDDLSTADLWREWNRVNPSRRFPAVKDGRRAFATTLKRTMAALGFAWVPNSPTGQEEGSG